MTGRAAGNGQLHSMEQIKRDYGNCSLIPSSFERFCKALHAQELLVINTELD